jgi:hypothetical protein
MLQNKDKWPKCYKQIRQKTCSVILPLFFTCILKGEWLFLIENTCDLFLK